MAVIFTSTIKIDDAGKWYFELRDEEDGRMEICADLDEFETKIEALGADYGGHIDEVRWMKDENVPPHVMDLLRAEMATRREKIEEQRGEKITPVSEFDAKDLAK